MANRDVEVRRRYAMTQQESDNLKPAEMSLEELERAIARGLKMTDEYWDHWQMAHKRRCELEAEAERRRKAGEYAK